MALAPPQLALPARRRLHPAMIPRWWHLLSLDAPTVAALWSWSMAEAVGVHLPWTALLLLAIGTWLIYVADRILDGHSKHTCLLRERHFFYVRHRREFLIAAVPAGLFLLWLIAARMNPVARHADIAVFSTALLYLGAVHRYGASAERWLPKELAVGVVFAAATAVPAWSRLPLGPLSSEFILKHLLLLAMVIFFATLCWLNCVAIEKWERVRDYSPPDLPPHRTTGWAQQHYRTLCTAVLLMTMAIAVLTSFTGPASATELFLACAMTAATLAALDYWQERHCITSFALRVAADAAMLTPLIFILVLR